MAYLAVGEETDSSDQGMGIIVRIFFERNTSFFTAGAWVILSPKIVDSPNTVLQKITRAIFCTQFVQCNDGGAVINVFLLVFTYSSNPLTHICEIV